MDLDNTITIESKKPYDQKEPNLSVIDKIRQYKEDGFTIVINTSRNVQTYKGNVGLINANTLPIIIDWLERHDVPYDEIYTGKPWCGNDGFYVDDKSIRPDEFVKYNHTEITKIITNETE
jgi:capsule biosynthesis phosphatase